MSISPFPKRLLIRKLNFENKTPSKKKRKNSKNLSLFQTDVGKKFFALGNLRGGAARNREIMKPVRTLVLNRLNRPWI